MKVAPPAPPLAGQQEIERLLKLRAPHAIEIEVLWERYRALVVLATQPTLRAQLHIPPGQVTEAIQAIAEAYLFGMRAMLRIDRLMMEHANRREGRDLFTLPPEDYAERFALKLVEEVP